MGAMNPAPGFKQYPKHHVSTRRSAAHVRVLYGEEVIADTRGAVELHEDFGEGKKTVSPVVYYIPREDVRMERLVRSNNHTHCPFKGDAAYFSIAGGTQDVAWSYEAPYDEMLPLTGKLAFYPDKVRVEAS